MSLHFDYRAPEITNPSILADLFTVAPEEIVKIYAPWAREYLLVAVERVVAAVESARESGTSHRAAFQRCAAESRVTLENAVSSLLSGNIGVEKQVRMLAWALDAPLRGKRRIRIIDTGEVGSLEWDEVIGGEDGASIWQKPVFVWLAEEPVRRALVDRTEAGRAVLFADAEYAGIRPRPPVVVLAVNPAWIERDAGNGTAVRLRFSGAAACAQAMVGEFHDTAWIDIRLPPDFIGLERDILLDEERELGSRGFAAMIYSDGTKRSVVISRRSFPKRGGLRRYESDKGEQ
jgi:hypothetical protein